MGTEKFSKVILHCLTNILLVPLEYNSEHAPQTEKRTNMRTNILVRRPNSKQDNGNTNFSAMKPIAEGLAVVRPTTDANYHSL
jgi:hypothetical protein